MLSLRNFYQKKKLPAVKHYLKAEEIISQHHDYSVAEIVMFQAEAYQFMREWVALYGLTGVMLIVGCTSKDGRPAKSARRSDREDEDMTHAYL
jgi:hypothetical protein